MKKLLKTLHKMPETTFQEDLKTFRGLKLKTFEKESTDVITNARKFLKYIDQVQETFTSLMISNPERQVKIFRLVEYELSDSVDKGVPDEQVSTETNAWKKFRKKLEIYFQTEKIQNSAQTRLKNIKQKQNQPAVEVLIEIQTLWTEAGYNDDSEKEKYHLRILLDALNDPRIKLEYEYSLMPGKTPLTIQQIIQVANVFAIHQVKQNSFDVNKTQRGGRRGRRFNYSSRFKNQNQNNSQKRCFNCNSTQHLANDKSCPAIGQKCRGCSKIGHFQNCCRSSGQNRSRSQSRNGRSFNSQNRGRGRRFGRGYGRSRSQSRDNFHSRKCEEEKQNSNQEDTEQRQLAELLTNSIHL